MQIIIIASCCAFASGEPKIIRNWLINIDNTNHINTDGTLCNNNNSNNITTYATNNSNIEILLMTLMTAL